MNIQIVKSAVSLSTEVIIIATFHICGKHQNVKLNFPRYIFKFILVEEKS